MKSAATRPAATTAATHTSFFAKGGQQDFFAASEKQPFFSKSANIQAKLTIGQPGDKYEQEADSVADKVVQRFGMNSPGGNEEDRGPLAADCPVQLKCAECDVEENIQQKGEAGDKERLNKKESPEVNDLQAKSIFESDETGENDLQRKCDECEKEEEESLQRKEEVDADATEIQSKEEINAKGGTEALTGSHLVQAKLNMGQPGDKYEKEADAVADKTIQALSELKTPHSQDFFAELSPAIQAKCATCDKQDKKEDPEEEKTSESPLKIRKMPDLGTPPETPPGDDSGRNNNGNSNLTNQRPFVQRRCRECEEGEKVFRKTDPDTLHGKTGVTSIGSRESIVAMARKEVGKVEAKQNDGSGKRKGADRLLEYFNTAAPGVWPDSIIETAGAAMPSWCGIFTVWAHKKAGKDIGTWQMGRGVSAFNTLTQTTEPMPGDIGYIDQPYQHHCIVIKVEGDSIHSIDGNSGLFSEVKENVRSRKEYSGFFTAFGAGSTQVHRKEEDSELQAKSSKADSTASSAIETRLTNSKGSGTALPEDVRTPMESAIGADFSNVKIHTDSSAVGMSKQLKAQAFTHGNDIYFNSGKFNLGNTSGKHLLAHELTHTIQQGESEHKNNIPTVHRDEENPNYFFSYIFKGEWLPLNFILNEKTLTTVNANPDSDNMMRQGLDIVLHFDPNDPVYETPTFLKTDRARKLIKAGIEVWPGAGIPAFSQFDEFITKRSQAVANTVFMEAVDLHLKTTQGIDPSFIDWKLLIPVLKADVFTWEPKNALDASEFDQYEWVLDLMMDEVKDRDPVIGAKDFDAADINKRLYPFIVNNEELFSKEVIQEHSEKFLRPWLVKIAQIKYIPDNFSLAAFEPGDQLRRVERSRELLLKDFIDKEVPDIMFQFVLDQWAVSGVNTQIWLKNLNIDVYKDRLLDELTEAFMKKATPGTEYFKAMKLLAVERVKFNIIRMFYFQAVGRQKTNATLESKFSKGFKESMEPEMKAIIENPVEYHDISVKIAESTNKFLNSIEPERSITQQAFQLVVDMTNALKVPDEYAGLLLFFMAILGYMKEFKTAIDEEKTKVKEAIRERIKVDYDGIANVVKNWVKVADEFMDKKFKPMLKTVALEFLAANKKEIQDILANYDESNKKYAAQLNEGADELKAIEEGLVEEEYDEVEYDGQVVTKKDLPALRTTIQFMRDEANARLSTKNAEKEKGRLREALEGYDDVTDDIKSDEFDWLDYTKDVFVEARKRLNIGEFPPYTTYRDIFTGKVVAEKSPFLAMVIQNWVWKENAEREAWVFVKMGLLGILSVAAMLAPGVGALVLGAIDISVGIGMGVKGVVDAKEVLRMAKLDLHGTIRGVSVEQAEEALKHAWFSLAFSIVLTVGPLALSRALKVRGKGGVLLSKETRSWEKGLNKGTRGALKNNPTLRKLYSEMDESVRAILTLCESPCIPLKGPTPAEVANIKAFMKKFKIPDNHPGFREYLHHPARREDLTSAMNGMKGVTNKQQFEAVLERAIQANVKQAGASATKVGGIWYYKRPDGVVVKEYHISSHGEHGLDRGTNRFYNSHHGIQDSWAIQKNIPGYSRDGCPAILLRDSKMGTPHQTVSARQTARFDTIKSRTYADERLLLTADMKAAGVPDIKTSQLLGESDAFFGKIYKDLEKAGKTSELTRIFGTWKPK